MALKRIEMALADDIEDIPHSTAPGILTAGHSVRVDYDDEVGTGEIVVAMQKAIARILQVEA